VHGLMLQYKDGIALSKISPKLAPLTNILKNVTISPFVADGWLYAGLDWFSDIQAAPSNPQLKFTYHGDRNDEFLQ